VAHVGYVHHVGHIVTKAAEAAGKQILGNVSPEVPDMRVVVDRGTAGVKPGLARGQWLKSPELPPKGIVKA
jgi:hypothetical protein